MSASEHRESTALHEFDKERATIARVTLIIILRHVCPTESTALLEDLHSDPEYHIELLRRHPFLCNMIMSAAEFTREIKDEKTAKLDAGFIYDISALIQLIALSYEENGAKKCILQQRRLPTFIAPLESMTAARKLQYQLL